MSTSAASRFDLTGRRALVTGASRGLGKLFARTLAQAGATVMITASSEDGLIAAKQGFADNGLSVSHFAANLSEPAQIEALITHTRSQLGGIDILVANAGVEYRELTGQQTPDALSHTLDINLAAPILLTNLVTPAMKDQGWGRLIYLSSVAGFVSSAQDGHAIYSASKAGLTGYMRTVAAELGPFGITANAIAPGVFMTDMAARSLEQDGDAAKAVVDAYASMTAIGRWGREEELSGPLLMLASDAGSYVTGTVLMVDGGFSIKSRPSGPA